jgi:ABC-type uncharacterized transport system substrate-binding protein
VRVIGRRELLIALAGALGTPPYAFGQQPASFRVGWISLDRADGSPFFEAFRSGLHDLGWVEGRNLTIEARWAAGSRERLDQMAAELVASKPHVIVTQGGALQPFWRTGVTIPIVFGFSGDPVRTLEYFPVRTEPELEQALAGIPSSRSEAAVVFPDALTLRTRERIARFGLEQRMPIVSGWAQFAESGSLMTYGPNLRVSYRRLATYVDRILKGAKPVELPTTVELVVNLKTAKALGFTIPPAVLARADRVIRS